MVKIERDGHLEPYVDMARELFLDYSRWLERRFGLSLDFQGFEQEVAEFPGVYTPPAGRLIVATVDGEAAGCIASKPKLPATCEMKRLYVRDSFRGRRLGEKLVAALIEEARAAGYRRMVLDTSREGMEAAVALYSSFGFVEIEQYHEVPEDLRDSMLFMGLELSGE